MSATLKNIACAVFFLISIFIRSQVILTSATHLPQAGDFYTVGNSSFSNAGTSGAWQTWNFSSATFWGTSTFSVEPSASHALSANVPFANTQITTAGVSKFYNCSASGIEYYGSTYTPAMLADTLSDPEKHLQFPFQYNDVYTDSFSGGQDQGGSMHYLYGTSTVSGDGSGTLIVPGNSYGNVLRVHRVSVWKDSSAQNVVTYNGDYFYWYQSASTYPLVQIWNVNSSTGGLSSGSMFLDTVWQSVTEKNIRSVSIRPNPVGDKLVVELPNIDERNYQIFVSDVAGREVFCASGEVSAENKLELATSALSAGVYTLRVRSRMQSIVVRFVKE